MPVYIPLGLCPDWAEWDPNQPVENAREAMQQADDWLGVPQVSGFGGSRAGCVCDRKGKCLSFVLSLAAWLTLTFRSH